MGVSPSRPSNIYIYLIAPFKVIYYFPWSMELLIPISSVIKVYVSKFSKPILELLGQFPALI